MKADVADLPGRDDFPAPGLASYVAGVLVLGWTLAYLDRQIIVILIEQLRHALHLSDTEISLVQGFAFSLFFVLAGLPIGRLVDRANRRNILFVGILLWSVATIACGLASSFWELFAARMVVGVGEACLAPASFSIIADVIRPQRRGTAMGLMVAGTSIGNAASIFSGGLILQKLGPLGSITLPLVGTVAPWQCVFFLVGAPGLLLCLLLLTIPEPERRERAAKDGDASRFFAALRQRPLSFALAYLAFALNMVGGYAVSVWAPVILMRVHHMPPGQVGMLIGAILLLVGTSGATIGGWVGDWLTQKMPQMGRLVVPLLSYGAMALVLLLWVKIDSAAYTILVFLLIGPLFGNMINGSSYPALSQMVPNEMRGQTIAVYLLIANLMGLGLAPTGVALITDYILRDPQMVRESVILVSLPAVLLGAACAWFAQKPYRAMCRRAQDLALAGASA